MIGVYNSNLVIEDGEIILAEEHGFGVDLASNGDLIIIEHAYGDCDITREVGRVSIISKIDDLIKIGSSVPSFELARSLEVCARKMRDFVEQQDDVKDSDPDQMESVRRLLTKLASQYGLSVVPK